MFLHSSKLQVIFGGRSSRGVKPVNQDAFAALMSPDLSLRRNKGAAFVVADGLSSSAQSQVASVIVVTEFINQYLATEKTISIRQAAAKVIKSLNEWLLSQNRNSAQQGDSLPYLTTMLAGIIKGDVLHVFHVGDARLYLKRQGQLRCLTSDHNHRVNGVMKLSRAMGFDGNLRVDYATERLEPDDLIAVTTDGVHGFLSQEQLVDLFSANDDQQQLEKNAGHVLQQALDQGADDNLTCLLVNIKHLDNPNFDELYQQYLISAVIPPALKTGNKLDQYEVLEPIHSSSRSHVYKVKDRETGSIKVIKVPSRNFTEDAQYLSSFLVEQWLGSQLNHEGILRSERPRSDSAFTYLVSEYIEGQSLRQWSFDHPAPKLPLVRKLAANIIAALRYIQRRGIVHCDLKPENILVLNDCKIKIVDLGAAQVDALQEAAIPKYREIPQGTADYIAPEYLLKNKATVQSDLFSLAAIIYELLCGKLPYSVDAKRIVATGNLSKWKYRSIREHREDIPEWTDLCLQKALAPDPNNRYESYSEFFQDFTAPNIKLAARQKAKPLIERDPVKFWQGVSLVLLIVLILQAYCSSS